MRTKSSIGPASFKPSEFMRGRRPHLFSDSHSEIVTELQRDVFDYQLETLTSRKEETKFEHFARKLAEKEICPNLLPQTGPTGGGDSKVDAETYAVSEEIAERWYTGIDQSAARERWAFAFSAKRDWQPKVKSDVEKIVKTGRGYARIFFISNQYVPDKKRAELEDELSREYETRVQILDRTWIIEKVFGNNRTALAIDALGIAGLANQKQAVRGPKDIERENDLRLLDEQIDDIPRYEGVQYQLAEDCLETAMLARGLGRPRAEVEGRFDRAERIADKVDHQQQRLRIAYARAWTAFWWSDDFDEFNKLYGRVEDLAKNTEQADDAELLFNLWQVLRSSVAQGALSPDAAQLESRTSVLKSTLDRLGGNPDRPNNAAIARTSRLLVDLAENIANKNGAAQALQGLKELAVSSEQLANYPIETLSDMLAEIGDAFAGNAAFDDLFEAVTEILSRRRGEGQAGEAYLLRGIQKLKADLPYEAIRFLGRAQHKLAKREYRIELVKSLAVASAAYEEVGLLWAARSSLIIAAHYALSEFHESGQIISPAVLIAEKIVWLELRIGRVPSVLAWSELADVLSRHLEAAEGPRVGAGDQRQSRDIVTGMLLLRSTLMQLCSLDFLVLVLQRLDLFSASMSLMYALGYEERLRKDEWLKPDESSAQVLDFFCKLLAHEEASSMLPERPEFLIDEDVTLSTTIFGCHISVIAENQPHSLYLAEAIIGSLEAFLATSLNEGIFPHRETFTVSIRAAGASFPDPGREDVSTNHLRISHSIPTHGDSREAQSAYSDWMMETVLQILTKVAIVDDIDAFMAKVVGDERGFERSINNAHVATLMTNIMGPNPKLRLRDWRTGFDGESFPLLRTEPWNSKCPRREETEQKAPSGDPVFGEGEPPPELLDRERGKHADMRVSSFIDTPLWDKATWRGTFFGISNPDDPPLFGLAFKEKDAAVAIFAEWRRRLGKIDRKDELRICILTGIDKSNPAAYRVVVTTKPAFKNDKKLIVIALRSNTMEPRDSRNLDMFLKAYARVGKYFLLPAHLIDDSQQPELLMEYWIGKTELTVRPAWQVGLNDPDMMALRPNDDPILPPDVNDPPVLRALTRIRTMRSE